MSGATKQKIKGMYQEAKGRVEDSAGDHWNGKTDQIKGKFNQGEADAKMNVQKKRKGLRKK